MKQLSNFQELQTAVNQKGEMVVLKNNGNNITMMSMEEYRNTILKKDLIWKLKQSEKEIENGEGIDSDTAFRKLRLKYAYRTI